MYSVRTSALWKGLQSKLGMHVIHALENMVREDCHYTCKLIGVLNLCDLLGVSDE